MSANKKGGKQRKLYRRTVALTAWQIGWDGGRPVESTELAKLAGVTVLQLWRDRRNGLLLAPEPKQDGSRVVIYAAATARAYLKKKRPSALVFQRPAAAMPLSQPAA